MVNLPGAHFLEATIEGVLKLGARRGPLSNICAKSGNLGFPVRSKPGVDIVAGKGIVECAAASGHRLSAELGELFAAAEIVTVVWVEFAVLLADSGIVITVVLQRDVPVVVARSVPKLASLWCAGVRFSESRELAWNFRSTEQSTRAVEGGRLDRIVD